MAAGTPTTVKPMAPHNWKQVFDSALKNSWDQDDRAHTPIYRRPSAPNATSPQSDDKVKIAAKALAALWGTRAR